MKENVIDVLMYLFENYMDEVPEARPNGDVLSFELAQAGFPRAEITKALSWLEELSSIRTRSERGAARFVPATTSLRVYSAEEQRKIDREARGFLLFLEQNGVLDATTRELVIDRVMALEAEEIDVDQIKWVILMVLFDDPGQEQAYAWIEDLVFNEIEDRLQ